MDRLKSADIPQGVSSVASAVLDCPTPPDQCPSTDPPPEKYTIKNKPLYTPFNQKSTQLPSFSTGVTVFYE